MGASLWAAEPGDEVIAAARAAQQTFEHSATPLAIVDKRNAQLTVYDAHGRLVGSTAALLGLMPGEQTFADAAGKAGQGRLPPSERTTPAGRYVTTPGLNLHGERVVWFDYANALAIHRLRPSPPHERRAERLASPSPQDNRITLGCVVVDPAFFDGVVLPLFGSAPGVVVVLRDDELLEP
jgi:hypothetical protein